MPSPRQHSSRPSSNTQPRSRHIKQTSKDLQHALQEVRHEPQEVRSCHEPRLESAQKELARKSVTNPLLRGAKEKIVYGAKGRHDDVVENATSVVQNYRRASEEARRRYFDKNSTAQRPAKPTFSPDQTGLYPSGHSNVTSPQYPYPQGQAGLHTSVGHSSTDTHISFNPPGRATNDPYASGSQYVPSVGGSTYSSSPVSSYHGQAGALPSHDNYASTYASSPCSSGSGYTADRSSLPTRRSYDPAPRHKPSSTWSYHAQHSGTTPSDE